MNANVGMQYPVAAKVATYTVGTSITYSAGQRLAEAVSASVSWTRNDSHFFGDDVELDTDNGVTGYSIDFEPSGLADAARAYLLGETTTGTGANTVYNVVDTPAPDVGFGYIRVMRSKAVGTAAAATTTYEAWWYHKCKFGISSEESRTKETSIEWRVPTLSATGAGVSLDSTGVLKFAEHRSFDTLAAAKTYLNGKAGIT